MTCSQPRFSEIQVLIFLRNVLEVLSFVHSKGVIHRDIKPPNLIRRRQDKELVLIDFGAVKQVTNVDLNGESGTRIATEIYTPREQEYGRPKLCSDIYSLGIVAIQAFIGSMPSINDDTNELDWQRQRQASPNFAKLLNQMICERPNGRHASACLALEEVSNIIEQYEPEIVAEAVKNPTPSKFDYINYWYIEANKLRDIYHYHRLAIYLYDKALEIKPLFWKAWLNRGVTLRYLKRYEESVCSIEKAIQINSRSPKLHFQRGISLSANERLLDALDAFNSAIQINPNYPTAWLYKGIVLKKLNRNIEALEAYEEAKKLRPSYSKTIVFDTP